jgi:DNA-binding NtrC family response regulator
MTTAILPCQEQTPAPVAQIQLGDKRTVTATELKRTDAQVVLLLTRDRSFEKTLREALRGSGGAILVARDIDDALQIVCARGAGLDLAVIDRDDGHGINLLSAINACQRELPIVVVTSRDAYHCAALAYANGAAACVAKPITATELKLAIADLRAPKLELTIA